MAEDDTVEHTLFIAREVNVFKIPPKASAGGHKSAEWLVADKIFTGRIRVVARGEHCELRLEEPGSGDLFATCPVPPGQRNIAVEPVADSSRYFVIRVVDPTTKRHAFLGMGFAERTEAFDFNVALSDHEKHTQRDNAVKSAASSAAAAEGGGVAAVPSGPPQGMHHSDAATLYKKQDLSLKEGQTIKIAVKKPGGEGGGFLSGLGGGTASTGLAPPPRVGQAPASWQQPAQSQQDPFAHSGGLDMGGSGRAGQPASSMGALRLGQPPAAQPKQQPPAAAGQANWTAFD